MLGQFFGNEGQRGGGVGGPGARPPQNNKWEQPGETGETIAVVDSQQPSAKLAALGNQLRQLKAMGDVEGVETAIVSIENQMAEIRKKRDDAKPKSQLYYSREQRVKQTAKQVDAAKKAKEARQKDLEQAQKAFEEADKMLQRAEESHTTAKAELEKEEPPRASDAMEEGDQPDLSQDQLCALLRAKIGESDEINQILGNLQAMGERKRQEELQQRQEQEAQQAEQNRRQREQPQGESAEAGGDLATSSQRVAARAGARSRSRSQERRKMVAEAKEEAHAAIRAELAKQYEEWQAAKPTEGSLDELQEWENSNPFKRQRCV